MSASGKTQENVQGVAGGQGVGVTPAVPTAANILDGQRTDVATTAAATLITVPAGRTWIGTVAISCVATEAAAGAAVAFADGVLTTAGAGVTPAAGAVFEVQALAAANAATGTVGSQSAVFGSIRLVVVAPGGNAVTVQAASTISGGSSKVAFSAIGELQ